MLEDGLDIRIKCPFVMEVCGPSQAGKSEWVARLIRFQNDILEDPVESVYWYSPHTHIPNTLKDLQEPVVHTIVGLPWDQGDDSPNPFETDSDQENGMRLKHRLIVLDDFAQENKNSRELTNLYTKGSHHQNISLIQITQNIFLSGVDSRTRSLNAHYQVLMKQQRDQQQIRRLARQVAKTNAEKDSFIEAYNHAVSLHPYGYLFVSYHPRDSIDLLKRTNIFPDEGEKIVYLDEKSKLSSLKKV